MIKQSISCDMCGVQKREANHWFLANQESGELHVSQWTSKNLFSPGTKHLCGENCLHKFLSEFLAHSLPFISAQQAADSAGTSVDVEPGATQWMRSPFISTSSRSGKQVNRVLVDDCRSCQRRRTL